MLSRWNGGRFRPEYEVELNITPSCSDNSHHVFLISTDDTKVPQIRGFSINYDKATKGEICRGETP